MPSRRTSNREWLVALALACLVIDSNCSGSASVRRRAAIAPVVAIAEPEPERTPKEAEPPLEPMPPPFDFSQCETLDDLPPLPELPPIDASIFKETRARIRAWLSKDFDAHSEAERAFVHSDPATVAALAETVRSRRCENRKRQNVDFCVGSGHYANPCCEERIAAARILGKIGAVAAVPVLARATESTDCSIVERPGPIVTCELRLANRLAIEAHYALATLGKRGAVEFLEDIDRHEPTSEVDASAIPLLLRELRASTDPRHSRQILEQLGTLDPAPIEAIPALIAALDSDGWYWATRALKSYGPLAFDGVDALVKQLETADSMECRGEAAEALGKIGHQAASAAGALVAYARRMLVGGAGRTPCAAAALEALGLLGPGVADLALPIVAEHLGASDVTLRMSAQRALGHFGTRALPYLEQLNSWYGIEAMGMIGSQAPAVVVPRLLEMLDDAAFEQQVNVAKALAAIGPGARHALPWLLKALGPLGRDVVNETLAIPRDRFEGSKLDLVAASATALGTIGVRDGQVISRLEELARVQFPDNADPAAFRVRGAATDALARLSGKEVVSETAAPRSDDAADSRATRGELRRLKADLQSDDPSTVLRAKQAVRRRMVDGLRCP